MSDNPEIRYDDPDDDESRIDEFLAQGVDIHIEGMTETEWWMSVTFPDGRIFDLNFGARDTLGGKGYFHAEEQG